MPALNFKSEFVDAIRAGAKAQTIRQIRKRPIKAGDVLHLYTGMRTAHCKKIGVAICESVQPIEMTENEIRLDGEALTFFEKIDLARDDGFTGPFAMQVFFTNLYGSPFSGVLIRFRLTSVVGDAASPPDIGEQTRTRQEER
jgi:uncharacterized protein YqfB (UPF0267 family)